MLNQDALSRTCMREWSVRSGVSGIRREVEAEDRGTCDMCSLDCKAVCEMLQKIAKDKRLVSISKDKRLVSISCLWSRV